MLFMKITCSHPPNCAIRSSCSSFFSFYFSYSCLLHVPVSFAPAVSRHVHDIIRFSLFLFSSSSSSSSTMLPGLFPLPLLHQHSLRRGAAERTNRELTSISADMCALSVRAMQTRYHLFSLASLMCVQRRGSPDPRMPNTTWEPRVFCFD